MLLKCISDDVLLESFLKAIQLKLDTDFICLLEKELNRRNLQIDQIKENKHLAV